MCGSVGVLGKVRQSAKCGVLGPWERQASKKEIEDILLKVKFDLPYLNVFKQVYLHIFKLVKMESMMDD